MDEELKETMLKVAEFSNEDKVKVIIRLKKLQMIFLLFTRINKLFIGGFVAAVTYMVLFFTDNADNFLGGLCLGITFGMILLDL